MFTLHLLDSTAVIRPTTTSPTSPIYLVLIGCTRNKLLTFVTNPTTDAYLFVSVV